MIGEIASPQILNDLKYERTPPYTGLRKGKWTTEEEAYASKIIQLFNRGMLHIPSGTTLRSYLSEKLNW